MGRVKPSIILRTFRAARVMDLIGYSVWAGPARWVVCFSKRKEGGDPNKISIKDLFPARSPVPRKSSALYTTPSHSNLQQLMLVVL